MFLKPNKVTFSTYRKTYNFSDMEVMVFVMSLLFFFMYLTYSFFTKGVTDIERNMFFLFLFPVSIFVFFELKSSYINRQRRKVLLKRKIQQSRILEKVFVFNSDENDSMVSLFSPNKEIELVSRRYIDIMYELKQMVLENRCDAIMSVRNEGGIVKGFLATKR